MLDRDFHNRKSHGYSWTLLCNGSCITHNPDIAYITFHSSCTRLFPDLGVQRLLHVTFCLSLHKQPSILHIPALLLDSVVQWVLHNSQSRHSVWPQTLHTSHSTQVAQGYSQTSLCSGSCICHILFAPTQTTFHSSHSSPIPWLCCAKGFA